MTLPSVSIAGGELLIGALDWRAQAALFYMLLPKGQWTLGWYMPAYFTAMLAAMVIQTPAGLGVLDTGVIVLMRSNVPVSDLVGRCWSIA